MSDKLMDTAPGGQSTQYESIKQFTNSPDRDVGQLGDAKAATKSAKANANANVPSSSLNKSEEEHLGEALGAADDEAEQRARREQGYGGDRDMRRDVGA